MKRFALVLSFVLVLLLLSIHAVASPQPASAGENAAASEPSSKQTRRTKPRPNPNDVFAPIVDNPTLPRVLLIGDSISMGYTFPVRRMLAGKANVHRIPVNGHDTAEGLARLDGWLGDKPWDVIHFNFGLHDLKRLKNGQPDVRGDRVRSPEEYARNLEALAPRLKATGAALIWATTTPVPAGARGRAQGDEVLFNEAAAKVMKKHGVRVNDLWGHIRPDLAKAQRRRDVHFTAEGSEMLARKVADEISAALNDRQKAGPADKP